ncbi:hypothetical protein Syn7803US13_7 [Synechococcus phage ACG-2014f]|uniref:Baseplate wedge protein n=3 Tax=Atlauavirus TaxID=2733092 RepID=A0A0E3G559_9CAUD|nr:baseplate wedge subunit [Synechococcus phage ACG-2014f_Syn7803C8]YP_009778734.1 baseplate wedge subunit [Synechococcus phage ACG-2014f_Syn7803US26]AIX27367.1 hypothetical protein Syn7803US13_7 [Synechococcus phage ACG-2014f]AIX21332.1 hypothetical protein Syn7803C8_8 [Synechococcus phage ACG-2014f_Syn7803C8]AIX28860.1 hypothetical protein Syn7803US26_7 [Synechococcus phage ACG-2014f_Syn7803US26]AIX29403.1 hypothetical protein Syn7803US30_7 [Synechococcus phage ACG-2014f]AIX31351.1 hypothet
MTYFRELPNLEYENFLSDSNGSGDYILMKNIFVRGKLRDDLQNVLTLFNKYIIEEDERPDQIALKLYGDPGLDWVIRMVGEITNMPNDWPISSQQLYEFCVEKYDGEKGMNGVKYYQTTEVKDSQGRILLAAGLTVDKNFTIPDPDPDHQGNIINPTEPVTNYAYETNLNDSKRELYVLKKSFIGQFVSDMRDINTYGFNSEFVNSKTLRVANTRVTNP